MKIQLALALSALLVSTSACSSMKSRRDTPAPPTSDTGSSSGSGGYAREISPDFDEVRGPSVHDPKHTPRIIAPKTANRGEWFDVTIEIGKDSRHPSLVEHHVRWIALYAGDVEINRTYLHPVMTTPKVTYTIRLEKSVTLRALEAPTHTAEWISEHKVKIIE